MSGEAGLRQALEIRTVLIPLVETSLLLPNAAVAELIDYRVLDALPGTPDWVVGSTDWRQRNLLVIDFERLIGLSAPARSNRPRIAVCHVLNEAAGRPFVGILAQAIPRLFRLREEVIEMDDTAPEHADEWPIHGRVLVGGQAAIIPDLAEVGLRLTSVV